MPHVGHVYVLLPLARPHIRHVCMLLLFVMAHIRYVHLGLHIAVSLEGRTTCIWSFGCGFTFSIAIGYVGFRLLFGTIIFL